MQGFNLVCNYSFGRHFFPPSSSDFLYPCSEEKLVSLKNGVSVSLMLAGVWCSSYEENICINLLKTGGHINEQYRHIKM